MSKYLDSDDEMIMDALTVHSKSSHNNYCSQCPLQDSEEEDEDGNYEGECTFLIANGALKIIDKLQKVIEEQEERIAIMTESEGWIPVEERLPKEIGTYLVVIEEEHRNCKKTFVTFRDYLPDAFIVGFNETVTHWKTFPKPPKGETENV